MSDSPATALRDAQRQRLDELTARYRGTVYAIAEPGQPGRIVAQMMADHRADACGTCDHKCPLFGGRTICALAPDHETPHQDGNIHISWDNQEHSARAVDFSLDGTRRGPSVNR